MLGVMRDHTSRPDIDHVVALLQDAGVEARLSHSLSPAVVAGPMDSTARFFGTEIKHLEVS